MKTVRLFLALVLLISSYPIFAQTAPRLTIDPASGSGLVFLAPLDARSEASFSKVFEVPFYQDYRPFALVLTNNSSHDIVALRIEWTVRSRERLGKYSSGTDSLKITAEGGGGSQASWSLPKAGQEPVKLGASYAASEGAVATPGERVLVAPGLFVRESIAKTRGSAGAAASFPQAFRSAEVITASIEGVVLEDGLVMGSSPDSLVSSLRASKAAVDAVAAAVRLAAQNGEDGAGVLQRIAQSPPDRENMAQSMEERNLARRLSRSRDWKPQLERLAAAQLPNFHR